MTLKFFFLKQDTEFTRKLREDFARCCFETLLQFSFFGPKGNPNLFIQSPPSTTVNDVQTQVLTDIGLVNKLVVTSLLQRFREVIIKYVEDEKLSGKCPLPRHRMAEMSFVLQALATLASSMKKAPIESGESRVINLTIHFSCIRYIFSAIGLLYPFLTV